jgi:hypothetical protein
MKIIVFNISVCQNNLKILKNINLKKNNNNKKLFKTRVKSVNKHNLITAFWNWENHCFPYSYPHMFISFL